MKSVFGSDQALIILTVCAFDDERYDYPDRLHGFLWLYRYGAVPLFRPSSTVDLMHLNFRHVGQ